MSGPWARCAPNGHEPPCARSAAAERERLAFDAGTGAQLWESVTDAAGSGSNDYAWAVAAEGTRVFVLGEIADFSGLLLQAHEAKTGAILWQQRLPGAAIYTLKDTLAAGYGMVFFAATDASVKLIVHAYDAKTGALRWSDRVEEGDRVGSASALVLQPESSPANGKDMLPETWERPTGENGNWEDHRQRRRSLGRLASRTPWLPIPDK